ncbi:MAG: hypothetical protein ABH863_04295 [Candidatus Micrarchaeota archaeon]
MGKEKIFARDLSGSEAQMGKRALLALEDDSKSDITTKALELKGRAKAAIVAEEQGILCGLVEAMAARGKLQCTCSLKEGDNFAKGSEILLLSGDIKEILRRERTMLNYLQLLSGIATQTRSLAERVGRGNVAAIRKNHPLLALSEKRAVQVGGGLAHRLNLSDGYLIKNTHLEWLRERGKMRSEEAVKYAVEKAICHRKKTKKHYFVEVEVTGMDEALAAAITGADAILVDNQTPRRFAHIALSIRKINKNILIEASGGITPENAQDYLKAGADFVSLSHLVMRSRPIGMHLKLIP